MSEEKEFLDKVKQQYAKKADSTSLKIPKECSSCGKKDPDLLWFDEFSWICLDCYLKLKKTGGKP